MIATQKSPKSYKILVVDDNRDFSSIVQMCLEIGGYQVKTAGDGQDAYLTYLLFQPDLVITDIQMPKVNGLELVRNIRRHNPDVRAIYMSGALDGFLPSLEQEKKRHSATILQKPFSRLQLLKLVSEHIQRAPFAFLSDKEIHLDAGASSKESNGA